MSQSFSFWLHDFSFMRSSYQISYQNNISLFWHHKTRPHAYLMLTEENSKINCCYKELYCAACAPPIYFSDINIYMSWYMTIFWHGIKANVLWEQTFLRVKWQFNRNPQINWTTHDVNSQVDYLFREESRYYILTFGENATFLPLENVKRIQAHKFLEQFLRPNKPLVSHENGIW